MTVLVSGSLLLGKRRLAINIPSLVPPVVVMFLMSETLPLMATSNRGAWASVILMTLGASLQLHLKWPGIRQLMRVVFRSCRFSMLMASVAVLLVLKLLMTRTCRCRLSVAISKLIVVLTFPSRRHGTSCVRSPLSLVLPSMLCVVHKWANSGGRLLRNGRALGNR